MKIQTAFVLIAALTSAAAVGCGSSSDTAKTPSAGATRASLHRAKGCGDLLTDLKADASYKLDRAVDRQIESIQKCLQRPGGTEQSCLSYGGYGVANDSVAQKGGASTLAPTAGGASGSSTPPRASSFSETNTQVKGVDEADFVKTDGANLYVLHGNAFKILKAWPASELKELSSLTIEGTPSEMFVDGGKVVVYSQVNGAALYAAAGVTPKAEYSDYGYASSTGGGTAAPMVDTTRSPGGVAEAYVPLTKITVLTHDGVTAQVARELYFEGSYLDARRVGTHVRTVLSNYARGPQLKYSVYDLYSQPANPPTIGADPKAPSAGAPATPAPDTTANPYPVTATAMVAALEQLRAANHGILDASQLTDWTPYTFTRTGGVVHASTVACEDFYIPTTGSTASGLTEVASIDLANPAALPRETAILGRVDTVYGGTDTLYLAAEAWVEPPYVWQDQSFAGTTVPVPATSTGGSAGSATGTSPPAPGPAPSPAPTPGGKTLAPRTILAPQPQGIRAWSTTQTHVHKLEFATDPAFPNYVASGTLVGAVKDQFSLDDRNGYLRIATTESRSYVDQDDKYVQPTSPGDPSGSTSRPQSVNHVFVLGVNGAWLDLVGDAGDLAPNERIYSVRFVDGRGYVVTFRQVDPLFVLDLEDPKAPAKIAELTIPGFSEYMHPLDANHLLTIGRDATGASRGLQLQIFDVTNGAQPVLAQKFTYTGAEYGYSEAESSHKAFTYFADRNLLAFPYYAVSSTGNGGMRSSLELFRVDATAGFAKLGSIDHTDLVSANPTGYCGGYYGPEVRRGVFLENFVFSVSYGGVIAKDATNLAATGSKLALPSPDVNAGYGPVCAGAPGGL